MKQSWKFLVLVAFLFASCTVIGRQIWRPKTEPPTYSQSVLVPFSEFEEHVQANKETQLHVESVSISERAYTFVLRDPISRKATRKVTLGPEQEADVRRLLLDHNVTFGYDGDPGAPDAITVAYSDFVRAVRADKDREPYCESVVIDGRQYRFWVRNPKTNSKSSQTTLGPIDAPDLMRNLAAYKVPVIQEVEKDIYPQWTGYVIVVLILPLLAILGLLILTRQELARVRQNLEAAIAAERDANAKIERLEARLATSSATTTDERTA